MKYSINIEMRKWMALVENALAEDAGNFTAWFGNSRVVDETGNPLVVYHGTNQNFDHFSKDRGGMATGPQAGAAHGFFFTNSAEEAREYGEAAGRKVIANIDQFEQETERLRKEQERLEKLAQRTNRSEDWRAYEEAYQKWEDHEIGATQEDPHTGVNVISAYLSIQNPLEVDFNGKLESKAGDIEHTVAKAMADGHDGVIMRNIYDSPLGGHLSDHYVVFSPEQIRRAS
jgi:hypothetical protein